MKGGGHAQREAAAGVGVEDLGAQRVSGDERASAGAERGTDPGGGRRRGAERGREVVDPRPVPARDVDGDVPTTRLERAHVAVADGDDPQGADAEHRRAREGVAEAEERVVADLGEPLGPEPDRAARRHDPRHRLELQPAAADAGPDGEDGARRREGDGPPHGRTASASSAIAPGER
ncbi:MAG: hypothetical protein H6745_19060 [Deltaproteobacteria bacterium]|nr:hypothetical protein [Deltaproteobacteria bacterium]